jgi:hypothetical protein
MSIWRSLIFAILLLLLGVGCASKEDRIFSNKRNEDLVKSFDLSKFKKFREEPSEVTQKIEKINKKLPKKLKKKKVSKKVIKKKKVIPPSIKKTEEKAIFLKGVPPLVDKEAIRPPKPAQQKVGLKVASKGKDGYPIVYPPKLKDYDRSSRIIWKQFRAPFSPGESFVMSLSYFGITAAYIKISTLPEVEIAGNKAYHFRAKLKSADFYKSIYSLDDTIESFIGKDAFQPIKYTLVQRESGQNVDDLQLFDLENLRTYHWYKRVKKGINRDLEKDAFIPRYFQDSFSALFFVRGLPLNLGDKFEFPIVTRGKIWILKVHVAELDEVDFDGEDIPALKLVAETHFPGVLKKKGDITFWYSNDKLRRLLRFEAKVKVGTLKGEMLEYTAGKR